jgi:hypothetical protein
VALQAGRIQKPARNLRKLLKKMPAIPSPEQVDDFRTNSRRVEETLRVLSLDSGGEGRRTAPSQTRRENSGYGRPTNYASSMRHTHRYTNEENDCGPCGCWNIWDRNDSNMPKTFGIFSQRSARRLNNGLKRISHKVEKFYPLVRPQERLTKRPPPRQLRPHCSVSPR